MKDMIQKNRKIKEALFRTMFKEKSISSIRPSVRSRSSKRSHSKLTDLEKLKQKLTMSRRSIKSPHSRRSRTRSQIRKKKRKREEEVESPKEEQLELPVKENKENLTRMGVLRARIQKLEERQQKFKERIIHLKAKRVHVDTTFSEKYSSLHGDKIVKKIVRAKKNFKSISLFFKKLIGEVYQVDASLLKNMVDMVFGSKQEFIESKESSGQGEFTKKVLHVVEKLCSPNIQKGDRIVQSIIPVSDKASSISKHKSKSRRRGLGSEYTSKRETLLSPSLSGTGQNFRSISPKNHMIKMGDFGPTFRTRKHSVRRVSFEKLRNDKKEQKMKKAGKSQSFHKKRIKDDLFRTENRTIERIKKLREKSKSRSFSLKNHKKTQRSKNRSKVSKQPTISKISRMSARDSFRSYKEKKQMTRSMKQLINHTLKRDIKDQIKDEQKKRERRRELQKIKDNAFNDQFKDFLDKLSQEKKGGNIRPNTNVDYKKGIGGCFGLIKDFIYSFRKMDSENENKRTKSKKKPKKKSVKKFHSIKSNDFGEKKTKNKLKYDNKIEKQLSNYANKNSISLFNEKSVKDRPSEMFKSQDHDKSLFTNPRLQNPIYKSDFVDPQKCQDLLILSPVSSNIQINKNNEVKNKNVISETDKKIKLNDNKIVKKNIGQYTFGDDKEIDYVEIRNSKDEHKMEQIKESENIEDNIEKSKSITTEDILNNLKRKTGDFEGIKEEENEDFVDEEDNDFVNLKETQHTSENKINATLNQKEDLKEQEKELLASPSKLLLKKQLTPTDIMIEEVRKSVRKETEKIKSAKQLDEDIQKEIKSYLQKKTISEFSQLTNSRMQSPENEKKKQRLLITKSEKSFSKQLKDRQVKTESMTQPNPNSIAEKFPDVAQMLEDIKKNVFEGYDGIHNTQGIPEGSQGDGFKGLKKLNKGGLSSRSISGRLRKYTSKDSLRSNSPFSNKFKSNLKKSRGDSVGSKSSFKGSQRGSARVNATSKSKYGSVNRQIDSINKKLDMLNKLNRESDIELQKFVKKEKTKSFKPNRQTFKPKSKDKRTTFPPIKPKRKKISEFQSNKNPEPELLKQRPTQLKQKGAFDYINFEDEKVMTGGMISDDSIKIFQVTDDEQDEKELKEVKSSQANVTSNTKRKTQKKKSKGYMHIKSKINTNLGVSEKSNSPGKSSKKFYAYSNSKKKSQFTNRKMSAPGPVKPKTLRKPPLPVLKVPKVKMHSLKKMVKQSITKDKEEYWKNRSLSSYRLKYRNDQHKVMKKRYYLNSNKRNTTVESIHLADRTRLSNPMGPKVSAPGLTSKDSHLDNLREQLKNLDYKTPKIRKQEQRLSKLRNSSIYSTGNRNRKSASKKSLLSQSFNRILSSQNKGKSSMSRMAESGMKKSIIEKM
jgi:hypothetical protein